jgi:hypothetical protein
VSSRGRFAGFLPTLVVGDVLAVDDVGKPSLSALT